MDQSSGPTSQIKKPSARACLQCRRVKMKCHPVVGSSTCVRCTRKSVQCVFHQNKRGRKPARRDSAVVEQDTTSNEDAQAAPAPQPTSPSQTVENSTPEDPRSSIEATGVELVPETNHGEPGPSFLESSVGLQPSSLLNRQAMKGRFSIQNILSTNHNLNIEKQKEIVSFPEDDPINAGVIPYHLATSLFDGFMKSLNPFVCVLDPDLHKFHYVRERSSFLMAVILAASAKAFNPGLHPALYNYSERLLVDSFAKNAKSPEVIQAMLLNTYWKQPDDTRCWSYIGYTIRLCMELGWHKLVATSDQANPSASELEIRQRRSIERTWLVLFVYDRSMSLQTGKPWMIERSEFIESVNVWYRSRFATSNDATLSALATLRLASADIIDLCSPQRPVPVMAHPYQFDSLLKTLASQIEAWRKHWVKITSEKDKDTCQPFLVSFFGTHLLVLLYSFQLQASISSPIGASLVNIEAFWITYTNALEMLKLVSDPSLSPLLTFAHDSIHTMTAYAAVFLIKLLLSVNKAVRQEFEALVLEKIENAARVFSQQSTPPTYTCALQANFLNNILQEYQNACRRRVGDNGGADVRGSHRSAPSAHNITSQTGPGHNALDLQVDHTGEDLPSQSSLPDGAPVGSDLAGNDQPSARPTPLPRYTAGGTGNMPGAMLRVENVGPASVALSSPSPGGWTFTNEEEWATMFMNAGFDIGGGVFVPG